MIWKIALLLVLFTVSVQAQTISGGGVSGGATAGTAGGGGGGGEWADVPLTFNSTIFTGMNERSNDFMGCGTQSHQSITNRDKGACCPNNAGNGCGNVTWTYVRSHGIGLDDDIVQFQDNGPIQVTIDHAYLENCGIDGDHPDIIQPYNFIPITQSFDISKTFMLGDLTPNRPAGACTEVSSAIRIGDSTQTPLLHMSYVYVKGGGQGIRAYTSPGYQNMHVAFENLCCESAGPNSSCGQICAYGQGKITVDSYVNVNRCTIVSGQVVVGAHIRCSDWIYQNGSCNQGDGGPGPIIGCPD